MWRDGGVRINTRDPSIPTFLVTGGIVQTSPDDTGLPGSLPGTDTHPIPEGLPTIISGSTPANLPISLPGRLPGSLPGGIPGSFPGNLPATFPGSLPGSLPGSFPGSPPDSGRHSGKLSDKPSEKGSGKQHRKSPDHHWDTTGTPPDLRCGATEAFGETHEILLSRHS